MSLSSVLARLVGAAEDHVVNRAEIHHGVALDQGLQRHGAKVVRPDRGQCAGEAADQRADICGDDSLGVSSRSRRFA
jgi:hypothetical protein